MKYEKIMQKINKSEEEELYCEKGSHHTKKKMSSLVYFIYLNRKYRTLY